MADIPETADIRQFLWGVENVGQVPAAAASAAATALEYHGNRMNEPVTNLSTFFIHYVARVAAGEEGKSIGTTLESTLKGIATYGACPDALWPFDATKATVKPSAEAYEAAKRFSKIRYYGPADVREAISKSYPVLFSCALPYRCLQEAGRTGVLPAPTADEIQNAGGFFNHAMVLVAYDKRANTVTARNCWGKDWGKDGHCTISLDVLKVIAPDNTRRFWVITTPESAVTDAQPATTAPAPPARPERLADMAAKMKEEIRDSLKKDLEEAQKRILDMMKKPGQP